MAGLITGVIGTINWHYYTAAAIHGYTVTRAETGEWSLTATVVLSDAFKLSQRPLTFVAPHDKGEWRWPIQALQLTEGALRASLGPPEN
jgi:hypothetical protein